MNAQPAPGQEDQQSALEQFGINLTDRARQGKLDPVIGRDSEIRRVSQVLTRRTKNNPVLIGEPGVGKTAVVEGLAQRIVAGDVAESLKDKELVSLDISALVAGAMYRGQFEERLKSVLKEITESDGQIITFIDELHVLMGAGGGEGSVAASNMLKPMLARGELRLIGATTLDEYREFIEKDAALERRFQQVYVGEPSVEDTIAILRGLKERYEAHHKVAIADGALVAAASLSHRYIPSRQLPDKAIDLIDEAASRLRMEIDSAPLEIDELRRHVDRLKLEELALKREKDAASKERLATLRETLKAEQARLDELQARWERERASLNAVGDLKTRLDQARVEAERAQREGNLEKASRLYYAEIPALERQVAQAENAEAAEGDRMVGDQVTEEDIAAVIAAWTGIPVGRLLQGESEKLVHLEAELGKRLIGQKDAVKAVSDAVRRSRAGISDPNRPTGSFLFLGPTGVGKTELAKALADFLFDDERAMVRIDMSEYGEKHSVARLVGAPPGYIGYEQGGQLTEAVRRRPYSVVLLDEVEKAHPEVFDILLQVLDDGRLTDGQGRTVDFTNTILILTSNLGSPILIDPILSPEQKREQVMALVRQAFRPEFLNRLDDVVMFSALSEDDLAQIVELSVDALQRRLRDRRLTLAVTPDARAWLAERGYDPIFGARPLRRLIQSEIQDRLAMALLAGGVRDGDLVKVDVAADGSGLVLTSAGAAPGTAGTDSGVGSASGSGGSDTEDVIEAELLDD
ncbi:MULTISPECIES: AAA family ATPase [unclassified Microbacterium]|uniref:ATP-dependent Clp protease ATP-binding subunit n=1 Tax=unclassified Microbacterium TaxID=2609290 RepID=UPI000A956F5F|nr:MULTISPECIES: AAA family ATPase [unclassified Microbacterium]MBN9214941.1 AAA family ATPase [Microbacterium sp.]